MKPLQFISHQVIPIKTADEMEFYAQYLIADRVGHAGLVRDGERSALAHKDAFGSRLS